MGRGVAGHGIFGREPELAGLRAELAAAMQGAGMLVLLTGEAGIGKTALLTAHAREARARGALVAWGRCHEMPGAPAYWPWLRVIEDLIGSDELPERAGDELGLLRDALRAAASRAATDTAFSSDSSDRFELFARVARGLGAVARKRGLLLAIDDIHWADSASVELLRFLASELAADAILLVATLRTHEAESEATLAGLTRLAQSFPLGPLERGAVEALLAERLSEVCAPGPSAAGGGERSGLVDEVLRRSGGNPFFALELAQLLRAEGAAATSGAAATPSSLPFAARRVIEQRLEQLPPGCVEVLRAGSVVGGELDLSLLASAMDRGASELRTGLLPAVASGLLQPSTDRPERFAFVHALVREVLYESLDEDAAAALHGRMGLALEARLRDEPAGWRRDEKLPRLAHHFYRALGSDRARGSSLAPGDGSLGSEEARARAADYAWQAGGQLLALLAYEEAAVHLERAHALLPEAGELARRIEIGIRLGQARVGLGDRSGAESILEETLALARSEADPVRFAAVVLAWSTAREEIGVSDLESNRWVEAALEALPDEDSTLRARLLSRLSSGLHLIRGAEERHRALADEALAMAHRLGDVSTLAFVQIRSLTLLTGPDRLEERFAAIEAMLESCAGYAIGELNALSMKIDACAEAGDRAGLDLALEAFDEKAEATRHPYFRWLGTSHHAALALMEGRLEDAEEGAVRALRQGRQAQSRTPGLHFAQQMFMLRGWQDRLQEIAPLVEGSAETARIVPAWRCALANLYEYMGRSVEARREFDSVAPDGFSVLPRDTTWRTSMMLLASVCSRSGDRANGEVLYRLILPHAGHVAVASPMIVALGPVDLRLGQLAILLGRYEDAARHLEQAEAIAKAMRALPWQAEIQYQAGRLYQARGEAGDPERAASCFDAADAIASSLGMALLQRWVAEARSQPTEAAAPVAEAGTARFARDGDGFALAFDGRTTRLRSMVGLGYIHTLLAEPDRELHVLDLARPSEPGAATSGDAGPHLDERARAAYRERAHELRAELAEAEACNDAGRRERVAGELEFLTAELERAFGLGGRERRSGAAAERARVSVTRAIKYATRKIGEHDPALAEHLERNIRTGTFCVYAPAARDRIDWRLEELER